MASFAPCHHCDALPCLWPRFAYGQTGSGKTFTLFGPENEANLFNPAELHPQCGIIPRAIRDVFNLLKEREEKGTTKYSVFCSFLQVRSTR